MTHEEETEPTEPTVTPVPEPDQDEEEEAHEHEAEEGTEPSEVPEVEAPGPRDEKELERAFKAIQKENTRHANRVSEIMGEDAQGLNPCPLCSHFVAGHIFPTVPPAEITTRTLAALGMASLGQLKESPYHEACETCGGEGEYLTHSRRADQRTLPCEDCGSRGWKRREDAPVPTFEPTLVGAGFTPGNGGNEANTAQGIDPQEAARRMQQAIAQAQGHAVGPTAEA